MVLVGCAAENPPMAKINDLEEHRFFFDDSGNAFDNDFLPRTLPKPLRLLGLGERQKFVIESTP